MLGQRLSLNYGLSMDRVQTLKPEEVDFTETERALCQIVDESLEFAKKGVRGAQELEEQTGTRYLNVPHRLLHREPMLYYNLVDHITAVPEAGLLEVFTTQDISSKMLAHLARLPAISSGRFTVDLVRRGRRDSYHIKDDTGNLAIRVFPDRVELNTADLIDGAEKVDEWRYRERRDLFAGIVTLLHEEKIVLPEYVFHLSDYLFFLRVHPPTRDLVTPRVDLADITGRFVDHLGDSSKNRDIVAPLKSREGIQVRRDLLDTNQLSYILESGKGSALMGFSLPIDLHSLKDALRPLLFYNLTDPSGRVLYKGVGSPSDELIKQAGMTPIGERRGNLVKVELARCALLAETEFEDTDLNLGEGFEREEITSKGRMRIHYVPLIREGKPLLDIAGQNIKFYPRENYTEEELRIALQAASSVYNNMLFSVKVAGGHKAHRKRNPPDRRLIEGIRFVDETVTGFIYQKRVQQLQTGKLVFIDRSSILREQHQFLAALGYDEYVRQGSGLIALTPRLKQILREPE